MKNQPENGATREDRGDNGRTRQGLMASFTFLDGAALGFPGALEAIQSHFSTAHIGGLSFLQWNGFLAKYGQALC